MIAGFLHPGSGLGNQLHRYVATRVFAEDHGYDFGMFGRENFKGKDFINLYMGLPLPYPTHVEMPAGRLIAECDMPLIGEGTTYYNPEFNFLPDNVMIDGEFQDERYFEHRLNEINSWLQTNSFYSANENTCLIGFRGGEFYAFPELGLPKDYFEEGISMMRKINPKMKFQVETDDPVLARQFFPDFNIIHNIEHNWSSMRGYHYAIIANSSFYILPRLLKHNDPPHPKDHPLHKVPPITIAPRYWARRNVREWSMPQNYYKAFKYI